jgi:hypothetical protein
MKERMGRKKVKSAKSSDIQQGEQRNKAVAIFSKGSREMKQYLE